MSHYRNHQQSEAVSSKPAASRIAPKSQCHRLGPGCVRVHPTHPTDAVPRTRGMHCTRRRTRLEGLRTPAAGALQHEQRALREEPDPPAAPAPRCAPRRGGRATAASVPAATGRVRGRPSARRRAGARFLAICAPTGIIPRGIAASPERGGDVHEAGSGKKAKKAIRKRRRRRRRREEGEEKKATCIGCRRCQSRMAS
jgi:hypothetical protein